MKAWSLKMLLPLYLLKDGTQRKTWRIKKESDERWWETQHLIPYINLHLWPSLSLALSSIWANNALLTQIWARYSVTCNWKIPKGYRNFYGRKNSDKRGPLLKPFHFIERFGHQLQQKFCHYLRYMYYTSRSGFIEIWIINVSWCNISYTLEIAPLPSHMTFLLLFNIPDPSIQ